MDGKQNKHAQGRQEQQHPQRPSQDPASLGPGAPGRGSAPEEVERRREEDLLRDERNPHDDGF
ncbi:hypothetical protein ACFWHQ_26090 [Streptomyces sp. NPDC060334]|uniref:hypothetical protein n=1 Tax=Streptomyces sp. NPDC060334 TaxID=3347099 RepID=UPI00365CDADE